MSATANFLCELQGLTQAECDNFGTDATSPETLHIGAISQASLAPQACFWPLLGQCHAASTTINSQPLANCSSDETGAAAEVILETLAEFQPVIGMIATRCLPALLTAV